MSEPVSFARECVVPLPPARLWPILSNTDRMNRALGLKPMELDGQAGEFVKRVRMSLHGLELRWREIPFEWVEGRYYRARREFESGPFELFEGGGDVTPEGGGSRVRFEARITPKGPFSAWLARLALRRELSSILDYIRRAAAAREEDAVAAPRRGQSPGDRAALRARSSALRAAPVDPAAADRLIRLLVEGYDDELARMRPFTLADRWGLDRLATLKTFLHAVKAGLLDLRWEVLCPNCAGAKERHESLAGLRPNSHCDGCGIEYGVNFDESVELRFSVSPSVRAVPERVWCVSSPAATPFALAQLRVPARQHRAVELELGAESFVLRHLNAKRRLFVRPAEDGRAELAVDLARAPDGAELRFRPGRVRLLLQAEPDQDALLRVERESWTEGAAKASLVATMQEFRDLFSSEVLGPGVEIALRNVAVLFTDLKDSTALYQKIGDATAYALVRDHFDYLFEIVARHGGAVIKTIGDAVMAAFPSGSQAAAAALAMQKEIGGLNDALKPKPPVVLKIGLHQGPAIVITQNERLDYFGTTVNVAARVQSESRGGDVLLTDALRREPKVEELLTGLPQERLEIGLKGLSESFVLWRLRP